jgi:hypothetical protein
MLKYGSFALMLVLALMAEQMVEAQTGGGMGGGGFGGPAVLGRGVGSGTGQRGGSDTGIGFFAGVLGTIDSGLTGLQVDANGELLNRAVKGVDGFAGVYGSKRFRRGTFGINYSGHYRQYSNGGNFSGTDQSLSLFTTRQVSKRSLASIFVAANTTNRPFGMTFLGGGIDPTGGALFGPSGEIFDNRIYFANATGEYTIQKSARLSFSMTGGGFIVRRSGRVLFGVNGSQAGANVAYRLSRRQTVSIGYMFFNYDFTRNFGDSYGNGVMGGYSIQLGKKVQLRLQAGAYRIESLGVRTATVDPIIAALLGVSSVSEVFYSKSYIPTGQVAINYMASRNHNFNLNGGITASPGNGIINTSRNTFVGAGYNYAGFRNLGIGATVNYMRLASLIGTNQVFETVQAAGNVNRKLTNQLFFTVTGGNRRFLTSTTNGFRRNSYFVSAGITWSPNEVPISIR